MKQDIIAIKEMLLFWNVKNVEELNTVKNGFIKGHQKYKFKNVAISSYLNCKKKVILNKQS